LERLEQISQEYERLRTRISQERALYFENHTGLDLAKEVEAEKVPKWKPIQLESERVAIAFVQAAKQLGQDAQLSNKDLVKTIFEEMLRTPHSIHFFLFIQLMWNLSKGKGSFCLETLEKIIRHLLALDKISRTEEYYLESMIDIWNFDTDEPIPIDILQTIILLDSEELKGAYDTVIKALAYLSDHPASERENVLNIARQSKRYQEDEYYQEWVD